MPAGLMARVSRLGDLVQSSYESPIRKENKQAFGAQPQMGRAVCSTAPLSGAVPFLRTYWLG